MDLTTRLTDFPAPDVEGTFQTADDLRLYERGWRPNAPRATVVVVHGYGEHHGRYAHIVRHLLSAGYAVYAYDQRGFGRSEGRPAFVRSFDLLLDDLQAYLEQVHGREPGRPTYLLGHSMGGAVVALYGIERGGVDGLVLSSPAVMLTEPALLQHLARLVGRFFPTLPTVSLDRGGISHDPDVVQQAQDDPLGYHGRIPARTSAELVRAGRRIRARMDALALPVLIIHGTADRLTDPRGSALLYQHAASDDKTLSLFEGFYHETFNEPDGEQVIDEIGQWLDEHTGAGD